MRVALMHYGDADDTTAWSGVPAGLTRGFERLGVEVVRIGLQPPAVVERALRRLPERGLALTALRSRAISRRARELSADVDAFLLAGGGPAPPCSRPSALYEDATFVQARALDPRTTPLPRIGVALRRRTKRRAYRSSTAACAVTPWAAASMTNDLGADPARVHVVGIGPNVEPRPVERSWWPPRFLFAGGNWTVKNGDMVLHAFGRVRERIPDARLDLAGRHPRVEAAGVHAHGFVPPAQLLALFEQATCFVLPSRFDPASIAVVEACTAGIPSVVSTVGDTLFLTGAAGRACDPDDEGAIVAAMLELARPETAQELGRAAVERARRFTWELVAERILHALALRDTRARRPPPIDANRFD